MLDAHELSLLSELRTTCLEAPLSVLLPKVLLLSRRLKLEELYSWSRLELEGYWNSNPAYDMEVGVPTYRSVAVRYFTIHDDEVVFTNPQMRKFMSYELRHGVEQLERMRAEGDIIAFGDRVLFSLLNGVSSRPIERLEIFTSTIETPLAAIRSRIVEAVDDLVRASGETQPAPVVSRNFNESVSDLHPIVVATSSKVFEDGHYRSAVLDTYIKLIEEVRLKSGMSALDGSPLMQNVFSRDKPVLSVGGSPDEQMGFMWLFSGAVMGIRNPNAHRLIQHSDAQQALEWLSFASALFRILDNTTHTGKT